MRLTGACNIQKHTGLGTIFRGKFLKLFLTHQFVIGGVHQFDPLYPLLSAADNNLSILRNSNGFLEFCGSMVQARRLYVINGIARFNEAVETLGYISCLEALGKRWRKLQLSAIALTHSWIEGWKNQQTSEI
jgi:hypothetical protein